jgi:hypothetical protein
MCSAHREWHSEFRHAQVDWAREMRQVREDLRQAFR